MSNDTTESTLTAEDTPKRTGLWSSLRGLLGWLYLETIVEIVEEFWVGAAITSCLLGLIAGGSWLHRSLIGLALFSLTSGGGAFGTWRTQKNESRLRLLSICALAFGLFGVLGWLIPRV